VKEGGGNILSFSENTLDPNEYLRTFQRGHVERASSQKGKFR